MDTKGHTAEKSLASVCAQTLARDFSAVCPFGVVNLRPCLERDKDEKSRTTVDVQPFLYQNAAKDGKTTAK